MKLKATTLNWALKHVWLEGDTDVFPRPFEFDVIKGNWDAVLQDLLQIDIEAHAWQGPRRLVVPKSEFAFRPVCQLDPVDAILFAGIIKEIGAKIEKRRSPIDAKRVFSNRYKTTPSGRLYSKESGWEQFWQTSAELCKAWDTVLATDLSDFYNQIYHHTLENQLDQCGVATEYKTALKKLLANATEGVSRGIPIGPHPSHLLAELSLVPIDDFLSSLDLHHVRYIDDIHIFCESKDAAHAVLYQLVDYLDKTQKMQVNKQKTDIHKCSAYGKICRENIKDKPINSFERILIRTVKLHTSSPYERVGIEKLSDNERAKLTRENVETVLSEYLDKKPVDYVRLRWFIRRLTQVGVPGGIEFIVDRFEEFLPAVAEVAQYFESAAKNYDGEWPALGDKLIQMHNTGVIQASEYLQLVVLSLFSRVAEMDHAQKLIKMYKTAPAICQRKIALAAALAGSRSWIASIKDEYKNSDPWKRRALIYSMRVLPDDERKFWLKAIKARLKGLDALIAKSIG